jgi:hypothetical protein
LAARRQGIPVLLHGRGRTACQVARRRACTCPGGSRLCRSRTPHPAR